VKLKFFILFFLLTFQLSAQKAEAWKTVSVYTGSILLNAVGDGLNDSGQKGWGHVCNASSIGLLLISPALMNYQKHKWGWYVASYIGLRIGLFDYTYNITRGLSLEKIGDTSFWDKGLQKMNAPSTIFGRSVFLTFGIAVPFNQLR
jgi:hypothetical protein